jgi:AcrR family transcriptional regulator
MSSVKARTIGSAIDLLRRHGVAGVTMRRVARNVGVTAAALYRHFPNRDAMLGEVAEAGYDLIGTWFERPFDSDDCNERILTIFDRYIQFALDEPQLFELMFTTRHKSIRVFPRDYIAGESRTGNVVIREVKRCIALGEWREDDVAGIVMTIWCHAHGLALLYKAGRVEGTQEDLRAMARDSISRAIAGFSSRD